MLSAAFWQGVRQFNQREFYACHDTLEALWMEAIEPDKRFYQGILQIAVACYHLENLNGRGATILLGEGIRRLADYQNDYPELNVPQLIEESQRLLLKLQHTKPEAIAELLSEIQASDDFPHSRDEQSLKFPKILKV